MSGSRVDLVRGFAPEEGYALSTEAGWNQTIGDWQRLLRLVPEGCIGVREAGQLVATAVAFPYQRRMAWIGMVLTAVAHRGKGYARTLMQQCLEDLDAMGVECVKLDATDLGRPVYLKLGFVDERPVSRWLRHAAPVECPVAPVVDQRLDESLLARDTVLFGADRSPLLRELAAHGVLSVPGRAVLFTRPGRTARHLGPCIAKDRESAAMLFRYAVGQHQSVPMLWDLFDDNPSACEIARELGFEPVRRLTRMYRGPDSTAARGWHGDIYALSAFEYG